MIMGTLINRLIDYESGVLSAEETLEFFAELIKTGQCWSLQGHYGRVANDFINNKLITPSGRINWDNYNILCEA